MKTKLIILDRDGVINYDSAQYIKTPDEWHPIPGSLAAIARLNQAGYCVVVATNQSGIGRGFYNLKTLEEIHQKLLQALTEVGGKVDEIFFCPHRPDEQCRCRKPQLGLFQNIQKKYSAHFPDVFFIGDSETDMQAALALGCKPILVLTGNGKATLEKKSEWSTTIPHFSDLACSVDFILKHDQ